MPRGRSASGGSDVATFKLMLEDIKSFWPEASMAAIEDRVRKIKGALSSALIAHTLGNYKDHIHVLLPIKHRNKRKSLVKLFLEKLFVQPQMTDDQRDGAARWIEEISKIATWVPLDCKKYAQVLVYPVDYVPRALHFPRVSFTNKWF